MVTFFMWIGIVATDLFIHLVIYLILLHQTSGNDYPGYEESNGEGCFMLIIAAGTHILAAIVYILYLLVLFIKDG